MATKAEIEAANKAPESFKFDEAKVKAHLETLDKDAQSKVGKPNYNPFLFLHVKVKPLLARYDKGERTLELQTAILTLPKEVPVVDPNWKPEPEPKKQAPKPIGLTLKEKV